MKTPRVLNYIARYWILLVTVVVFAALALSNWLYDIIGTLIYLPVLVFLAAACALLLRNIFNRDTSDRDADIGQFVREWRELDPRTRVILTVVQWATYFLGACIIAAGLA